MPADKELDLCFANALSKLMATHKLADWEVAERCGCSASRIYAALHGSSTGIRITKAIIEAFSLWEDPALLRQILVGYLLQKFPREWLVAADLVE